ncbi:MAG TPA: type II toxin-antitoxin system prevent-host-death family antitoxin [Thermoanaerobaculia bacterium]|jgi:prevent-host-death family protein|nr:type II toxin-antitoxin system prevent-host-death family antitoxin [Thermoanaerobaculia bacterium]
MTDLTMAQLEAIAGEHGTCQASEVKANWRGIVRQTREKEVIVTNYNRPEAVVMSAARYAELVASARANDPLRRLRADFERELAALRAPGAADKLRELFAATPEDLADAANAAPDDGK